MLGALATGEAWLCRFSTLRGNADQVSDKYSKMTELRTKVKFNSISDAHPLFEDGETGDSEGHARLGGGSSSSSSSEELSSVRSITSTFLLLSLDDPRLCSCVSVRDKSTMVQLSYTVFTDNIEDNNNKKNNVCYVPLSTPLYEAETSCTSFLDFIGAQLPSSLNWISSQSEQLLRISMNNLWKQHHTLIQYKNL